MTTLEVVTEFASIVDAPAANIWGVLAAWGCERLWMPHCTASALEGFGIGSIRHLTFTYRPGVSIRESLEAIDPVDLTIRFRVYISTATDALNFGNIKLEPLNDTQTRVTWKGESDQNHAGLKESLDELYEGLNKALSDKLKA